MDLQVSVEYFRSQKRTIIARDRIVKGMMLKKVGGQKLFLHCEGIKKNKKAFEKAVVEAVAKPIVKVTNKTHETKVAPEKGKVH